MSKNITNNNREILNARSTVTGQPEYLSSTGNALNVNATVSLSPNSSVNVSQIAGTTTSVGNGATDAGTQRVTISNDSTGQVKLATGANVIGSISNTSFAVTQATGSNLHTAVDSIAGVISTNNSTTSVLGAAGVFTGTADDITNYGSVRVSVFASHASATDGMSFQQSSNGTNWDIVDSYTVAAATGKVFSVNPVARFFRIVYTNGGTLQTSFRLQVIYNYVQTLPSSQRPTDGYTNETDLEQNQAFLMGYNGSTWDRLRTTGLGVLTTSSVLTAGAASIGSISAITANIIPGVSPTHLGKAEDAAHASGDTGVAVWGVRNDNLATTYGADQDYTPFATDLNGRVMVAQKAATATLSNVSTSGTTATLLAANSARIGATITNESATVLFVKFGTTASATSYTVSLAGAASAPYSYYEVPAGYTGRIDGILASSTGTARVTEIT